MKAMADGLNCSEVRDRLLALDFKEEDIETLPKDVSNEIVR